MNEGKLKQVNKEIVRASIFAAAIDVVLLLVALYLQVPWETMGVYFGLVVGGQVSTMMSIWLFLNAYLKADTRSQS